MLIKDRLYPLGIKDNNGIEYFLEYSPYEHPTLGYWRDLDTYYYKVYTERGDNKYVEWADWLNTLREDITNNETYMVYGLDSTGKCVSGAVGVLQTMLHHGLTLTYFAMCNPAGGGREFHRALRETAGLVGVKLWARGKYISQNIYELKIHEVKDGNTNNAIP